MNMNRFVKNDRNSIDRIDSIKNFQEIDLNLNRFLILEHL